MAAGLRFLPKPWRFLHQFRTEFSRIPSAAIPACRQSSTASKSLSAEEARAENWRRRVDLAASYRILEKYNLHEGVCSHLSMMAPAANGDGEVMLIIPYGLHWSEVGECFIVTLTAYFFYILFLWRGNFCLMSGINFLHNITQNRIA